MFHLLLQYDCTTLSGGKEGDRLQCDHAGTWAMQNQATNNKGYCDGSYFT